MAEVDDGSEVAVLDPVDERLWTRFLMEAMRAVDGRFDTYAEDATAAALTADALLVEHRRRFPVDRADAKPGRETALR